MSDFVIEKGILTQYTGPGGEVVIPHGVRVIGRWVFQYNQDVQTVVLPDTVKIIEDGAFMYCSELTDLTWQEGLEVIGEGAFARCSQLRIPPFPDSLREIRTGAFLNCGKILPENIPPSVDRAEVFCGCTAMADENGLLIFDNVLVGIFGPQPHRVIPEGVTELMGCAANNRDLQTLQLPTSLRRIGSSFGLWSSLVSLTVPDTVTYIGPGFLNCAWYLRELTLSRHIRYLDGESLTECNELEYLQAPGLSWQAITERELEIPATVGFLCGREKYPQFYQAEPYVRFALNNKRKVLEYFYKKDDIRGVRTYDEMGMITRKNFEKDFLQPAMAAKATGCIAWLLNWKDQNLGDLPGVWDI